MARSLGTREDRFLTISSVSSPIVLDGFRVMKNHLEKKIKDASSYMAVSLRNTVKKQIRKAGGKNQVIPVPFRLYRWAGDEWKVWKHKTPTQFLQGKKIVAPNRGYGGKTRIREVQDMGTRRWNKASKPGESPITHPTDIPGWTDHWLRSNVYFQIVKHVNITTIRVYIDRGNGGENVDAILDALETGGTVTLGRKYISGYRIHTIRHGYTTARGDGVTHRDRKRVRANVSGRTRRSHERKFKEPHVALTPHWTSWKKEKNIAARPFMRVAFEKFLENSVKIEF